MNTMTQTFIVTYSYNAGLLGTDKSFNTEEEARAFVEEYKTSFEDCDRYYSIKKYTVERKRFGKKVVTVEEIENWFEE